MASPRVIERVLLGGVIACVIAVAAFRARSLSRSGAVAAILVGTASVAAGWNWGALLVSYFVVSSALSRFRHAEREKLTAAIVEKGGARDAVQVLANGGVFALLALATVFPGDLHSGYLTAGALGALAAATADTWGTEIGTLFGGIPRSVRTFRPVTPGTSGGVSVAGSLATVAGAGFIAYLAPLLGIRSIPAVVLVAGALGAFADSALGDTVQSRRWCATCEQSTERAVHTCGTVTSHSAGFSWLSNDVVNLLATVAGAALAILILWI